jgi:hypothetical protein
MGKYMKLKCFELLWFQDSLKHACKVPNTEQPFACIDLMFLATLLDKMLGLKQVNNNDNQVKQVKNNNNRN